MTQFEQVKTIPTSDVTLKLESVNLYYLRSICLVMATMYEIELSESVPDDAVKLVFEELEKTLGRIDQSTDCVSLAPNARLCTINENGRIFGQLESTASRALQEYRSNNADTYSEEELEEMHPSNSVIIRYL